MLKLRLFYHYTRFCIRLFVPQTVFAPFWSSTPVIGASVVRTKPRIAREEPQEEPGSDTLASDTNEPGWWGEGDDMFFVDGEPWPPHLHGTGTEDQLGTCRRWAMSRAAFPTAGEVWNAGPARIAGNCRWDEFVRMPSASQGMAGDEIGGAPLSSSVPLLLEQATRLCLLRCILPIPTPT